MWEAVKKYFSEFKILKNTPAEFWTLNLVINFFEMLAYFSIITVLTLYLTENVGFDDQWAGNTVGIFTLMITVIIFFSGFIIDSIGVKKALLISMVLLVPTRLLLGVTGPVENWYLENKLNVSAARQSIEKDGLDKAAFTNDPTRLTEAQTALVKNTAAYEDPQLVEALKPYQGKDLIHDSQALREAVTLIAQKSPAVQQQWSTGLEAGFRDQEQLKKIVIALVAENPAVAKNFFMDLAAVSDNPARLKAAVIQVVKAYPELRAQHSIQNTLKVVVFIILIFMALGEALMVPAIYAALRSYTNKRTSGTAFNFQYLTMNIGAVLSFVMFDYLRLNFGNESIFLAGTVFAVICVVGALFLRENIKVEEDGSVVEVAATPKGEKEMPWTIALDVMKEPAFWRFMLFILLLIGVKLTFTHQFLVMPKYYTRVLGADANVGFLNTINPAIITLGLVLFIPVIMRFSVFRLIIVGTIISSLSVFILAIPGKAFAFLNWSIEEGYFFVIVAQVVVFAFGELIWSPRLSEYTVTIAPKGREGSYMSMAALPMFIAKPLNGWLSGLLLTEYCPEGVMNDIVSGARTWHNGPEMMWIIFGLIAVSSPILVILLRNVIKTDKKQDEPAEAVPEG